MGKSETATELIDRVRFEGNYENSSKYTDARITTLLDIGKEQLHRLLRRAQDDRFTIPTTLTITANSESVALPSDFWILRKVALLNSAAEEVHVLRRIELRDAHRYRTLPESSYYERGYLLLGDNLHVRPVKAVNTDYKLYYLPSPTDVGSSLEGYAGYADFVVQYAIYRLDLRERKPINDRLREIERLREEILSSSDHRDSNEPMYLEDLATEDPIY